MKKRGVTKAVPKKDEPEETTHVTRKSKNAAFDAKDAAKKFAEEKDKQKLKLTGKRLTLRNKQYESAVKDTKVIQIDDDDDSFVVPDRAPQKLAVPSSSKDKHSVKTSPAQKRKILSTSVEQSQGTSKTPARKRRRGYLHDISPLPSAPTKILHCDLTRKALFNILDEKVSISQRQLDDDADNSPPQNNRLLYEDDDEDEKMDEPFVEPVRVPTPEELTNSQTNSQPAQTVNTIEKLFEAYDLALQAVEENHPPSVQMSQASKEESFLSTLCNHGAAHSRRLPKRNSTNKFRSLEEMSTFIGTMIQSV